MAGWREVAILQIPLSPDSPALHEHSDRIPERLLIDGAREHEATTLLLVHDTHTEQTKMHGRVREAPSWEDSSPVTSQGRPRGAEALTAPGRGWSSRVHRSLIFLQLGGTEREPQRHDFGSGKKSF